MTLQATALINEVKKHETLWKIIIGLAVPAVYFFKAESVVKKKIDKYRHEEELLAIAKTHNLYEALVQRSI